MKRTAFRNRALYRATDHPRTQELDPAIVKACVPLWKFGADRAHSRYGTGKPGGNHKGRDAALYSVDDELKKHGITWATRALYLAYERAVRAAARRKSA